MSMAWASFTPWRSLAGVAATATFMAAGFAVVFAIRHLPGR